jgi:hypothetical protein
MYRPGGQCLGERETTIFKIVRNAMRAWRLLARHCCRARLTLSIQAHLSTRASSRRPSWRSWLPYPIDPPQDLYAEIYGSFIEVLRRNATRVRQVADVLLRDGEISELQLSSV